MMDRLTDGQSIDPSNSGQIYMRISSLWTLKVSGFDKIYFVSSFFYSNLTRVSICFFDENSNMDNDTHEIGVQCPNKYLILLFALFYVYLGNYMRELSCCFSLFCNSKQYFVFLNLILKFNLSESFFLSHILTCFFL